MNSRYILYSRNLTNFFDIVQHFRIFLKFSGFGGKRVLNHFREIADFLREFLRTGGFPAVREGITRSKPKRVPIMKSGLRLKIAVFEVQIARGPFEHLRFPFRIIHSKVVFSSFHSTCTLPLTGISGDLLLTSTYALHLRE